MSNLNKSVTFERMVNITVSPQARKVLYHAGKSEEDFVDDYVKNSNFSLGGHNVVIYLERLK